MIIVAVVILIGLFSVQRYGIDKVGWLFAPVVFLWLVCIGAIGAINIYKYDRRVWRAFNPMHIIWYFRRGRKRWTSLGGIMLSITGTEALFADLSHFPVLAIQIAFTLIVFPCLLLAYTGQAAYLMKNQEKVVDVFYHSIPDKVYWPVFVVATAAAVVASQATISATHSIIKQALALGCFPRVKVIHTSKKYLGQIYIPDINWILLILCIAITAGFKNQTQIGNAYGTAVAMVMVVTTLLMVPIMLLVWRSHWILVASFTSVSLLVELTYLSAVLFKVGQGGWVPLVIAATFLLIMYVWHYGTLKRVEFEIHSKVSMAWILGLGPSLGLVRVPGIGFVYTELASGVPSIFSHFITNLPAIHSVVVFVCVKYLPVYTVPQEERILVKRIGSRNFHIFRCVVRYGYKDVRTKDDNFEKMLYESLTIFIRLESLMESRSDSEDRHYQNENSARTSSSYGNGIVLVQQSPNQDYEKTDELEFMSQCRDAGLVHILGNTVIKARRDSGYIKKVAINYVYAILKRICRENSVIFNVPHENLLNVGQIFYV